MKLKRHGRILVSKPVQTVVVCVTGSFPSFCASKSVELRSELDQPCVCTAVLEQHTVVQSGVVVRSATGSSCSAEEYEAGTNMVMPCGSSP